MPFLTIVFYCPHKKLDTNIKQYTMIRSQATLKTSHRIFKRCIHASNNNTNTRYIAPKSFAVGMLGGTLGSFVGIGGGVFTIPLMTSQVFGLTQRQAMATNLVAVMCTGIAGASAYAMSTNTPTSENEEVIETASNTENNNVQLDMAITAAVFGMITARLGAKVSNKLTEKALKRFLAGVMYLAAPAVHLPEIMKETTDTDHSLNSKQANTIRIGAEMKQHQHQEVHSEEYIKTRLLPAAIIGSTSGIFSGLTGLGGGIITVSAFSLLTPLTYKQALGTSLFAMTLPATSAAVAHHFNGNIAWRVASFLAAGAGTGAFVGGKIGADLPEKELKCCFSAAMLALGTRVLLRV